KARTRSRTAPCGRPTACDRGSGSAAAPSATAALHVATTSQGLSTAVADPCARPAILDDHLHETTTRVIILLGPLRRLLRISFGLGSRAVSLPRYWRGTSQLELKLARASGNRSSHASTSAAASS